MARSEPLQRSSLVSVGGPEGGQYIDEVHDMSSSPAHSEMLTYVPLGSVGRDANE